MPGLASLYASFSLSASVIHLFFAESDEKGAAGKTRPRPWKEVMYDQEYPEEPLSSSLVRSCREPLILLYRARWMPVFKLLTFSVSKLAICSKC